MRLCYNMLYIYIYTYKYIWICWFWDIYIFIYVSGERERERRRYRILEGFGTRQVNQDQESCSWGWQGQDVGLFSSLEVSKVTPQLKGCTRSFPISCDVNHVAAVRRHQTVHRLWQILILAANFC